MLGNSQGEELNSVLLMNDASVPLESHFQPTSLNDNKLESLGAFLRERLGSAELGTEPNYDTLSASVAATVADPVFVKSINRFSSFTSSKFVSGEAIERRLEGVRQCGAPPMRLLPYSVLKALGRFPHSDEHVTADALELVRSNKQKDSKNATGKRLFSVLSATAG